MPRDHEALADLVVLTVKAAVATALAPVLERLATSEQCNRDLQARILDLTGLRDRVVSIETKAAQPLQDVPVVDLSPVLERLSASEQRGLDLQARVDDLLGMRDRLVTVETKAAQSVPLPPTVPDLAPVLERLAVAEQSYKELQSRVLEVSGLRDRIVTVETKAAQSAPVVPIVDLTPLLERVAAAEARLVSIGDIRDRLVTMETKAVTVPPATPENPVDLSPVLERLASAEARLIMLGDLRDRVVTIETKAAQPVAVQSSAEATEVRDRLIALETSTEAALVAIRKDISDLEDIEHKDAIRLEGYTSFLQRDTAALSERVAVSEVRAQVPGPPGPAGANGKDGADGLGWDDLSVEQQNERTAVVKAAKGERVKAIGTLKFNHEVYRNVWSDGTTYERGDCCTWGGSEWHANETTIAKPGESKAWSLKVKRGRDGKDGKDAVDALPVVTVGRAG